MKKDILVHVQKEENGETVFQTAVVQNGELIDYDFNDTKDQSLVGNIYKGSVTSIFPGTQSCFVDIGLQKNSVLYAKDLNQHPLQEQIAAIKTISGTAPILPILQNSPASHKTTSLKVDTDGAEKPKAVEKVKEAKDLKAFPPIEGLLRTGQQIIVQVIKDATGDKGPRITTKITLPGKYAVLIPNAADSFVSRRITDSIEQARLKSILNEYSADGYGLIARTESEGISKRLIRNDIYALLTQWAQITRKINHSKTPLCIHVEFDFYKGLLNRSLENDIAKLITDDKTAYKELLNRASSNLIDISYKIQHFAEPYQLFSFFGIAHEIKNLSMRKIWLKCGAYIVIDKTEALTVIDVNSGKYNGKTNPTDTILRINTEAVLEVARQLRLRDIGGIIIIDIIRMQSPAQNKAVIQALENALKQDRRKTSIAGITRLGLLEMTRKKTGVSLDEQPRAQRPANKSAAEREAGIVSDISGTEHSEDTDPDDAAADEVLACGIPVWDN